jgi:hypothetical protein
MSVNHHGAFPPADRSGDQQQSELMKRFHEQIDGRAKRFYPSGRVRPDDDGELAYAVGNDPNKGIVFVDFGKQVNWLGLEPKDAINMAQLLIKHARAVSKEPIAIQLH